MVLGGGEGKRGGLKLPLHLDVSICVSHSAMSNSLQPHRLQPTRLLCPWDSPGKNIGMNCHALLQRIFLTQRSNLHLLPLLHWEGGSLPLASPGKPLSVRTHDWIWNTELSCLTAWTWFNKAILGFSSKYLHYEKYKTSFNILLQYNHITWILEIKLIHPFLF